MLKIQGLGVAPVSAMGQLSAAWFQVGLIVAEVVLGCWLATGVAPLGAWVVALVAFSAFAVFSLYQGWIGRSSCGCFGRLSISPWYAFGLDIAVLAGLVLGHPDLTAIRDRPRRVAKGLSSGAFAIAGIAVLASLVVASAQLTFGTVPGAIAYFRGERISTEPSVVDVGEGPAGELRHASVTVTNWTDRPIQIFGGTSNCSATVLHDLPVTIAAHESRALSVQIRMKGSPGVFTRKAAFVVNDEGFKMIHFPITGRISEDDVSGQ